MAAQRGGEIVGAGAAGSGRQLKTRDPLVDKAAEIIGGPLGRRARSAQGSRGQRGAWAGEWLPPWRPAAAALVLAATLAVALGVAQKGYCISHGWGGSEPFWHMCYSDLPSLFTASGLRTGTLPYGDGSLSLAQPVGSGLLLWVLALLVPAGPNAATWFVALWAVAAGLMAAALVIVTVRSSRRDPWRASQVALSPLLVTVVLVAPDIFGVLLVSLGVLWWAQDRPGTAGVVLGAALSARSYAIVIIVVLALIAVRAGVAREAARMVGAALLTWLGIMVLVALPGRAGVFTPYRAWLNAVAEFGGLTYLPNLFGASIPIGALTAVAITGWIAAVAVAVAMTFVPAHRPLTAEVVLVALVLVLATSKSVPVQSALWLLPIIALARLPWRDVLIWTSAELLHFGAVWLYRGGWDDPERGLPGPWYSLFILLRFAALAYLVWIVMRRAWHRPPARRAAPPLGSAGLHDPDGLGSLVAFGPLGSEPPDPSAPWAYAAELADPQAAGSSPADDSPGSAAGGPAGGPTDGPAGGPGGGIGGGTGDGLVPAAGSGMGAGPEDAWSGQGAPHARRMEEPDELAGPAAGRPDAVVITFV